MDPLGGAASITAVVQISAQIASLCGGYLFAVSNARQEIESLHSKASVLHDVLEKVQHVLKISDTGKLPVSISIFDSLNQCSTELDKLKKKLDPGKTQKAMSRFGVRALKWPFTTREVGKTAGMLEGYTAIFNTALSADQIFVTRVIDEKLDHVQQDQILAKLPCVHSATFGSFDLQHDPECLRETRVDLRRQIVEWGNNPSEKCIFWLKGMAGTGKSTIARTIARTFADNEQLGASFFFSSGGGDRSNAAKFFSTVAIQLARISPSLRSYICKAIAEQPNIAQRTMLEQWTKLILQPLTKVEDVYLTSRTLIIVIDALDECERQDDIQLILRLLTGARDLNTVRLRVLVTSRPEVPIETGFHDLPKQSHEDFILHNISDRVVAHDIELLVRHELDQIKQQGRENQILSPNWPTEQQIKLLVERADGLFIYAATICRFVKQSWFPENNLSLVLRVGTGGLDKMYTQILKGAIIGNCDEQIENETRFGYFRQIIGSIVVLFDSISAPALTALLSTSGEAIYATLRCLGSVLDVPNYGNSPIRLLHPSFRDFLLDNQRCLDHRFWVNEKNIHGDLGMCCIKLMSSALRRNACDMSNPGSLVSDVDRESIDRCLPPEVQYACQYWVSHIQRSEISVYDNGQVHLFLREHLLHWLEALSMMGEISEGLSMITNLELMSTGETDNQVDFFNFIHDAKRFILNYRYILERAPLQIYSSALIFSPRRSQIRKRFLRKSATGREVLPNIKEYWGPSLQTLEGHSDSVFTVMFSPDGQLVASGSRDNTVRLWDARTGEARGTLEGHSGSVNTVVFSPDGQLVASGSWDNTVRLWDARTGEARGTLEGHSDSVNTAVFSPDGQLVASGSRDKTVRLWDVKKESSIHTLHDTCHEQLSFSDDSMRLNVGWQQVEIEKPLSDQLTSIRTTSNTSYSLDSTLQWVIWKGIKILWLPADIRPGVYAVQDNKFMLANGSGRMTFLRLNTNADFIGCQLS